MGSGGSLSIPNRQDLKSIKSVFGFNSDITTFKVDSVEVPSSPQNGVNAFFSFLGLVKSIHAQVDQARSLASSREDEAYATLSDSGIDPSSSLGKAYLHKVRMIAVFEDFRNKFDSCLENKDYYIFYSYSNISCVDWSLKEELRNLTGCKRYCGFMDRILFSYRELLFDHHYCVKREVSCINYYINAVKGDSILYEMDFPMDDYETNSLATEILIKAKYKDCNVWALKLVQYGLQPSDHDSIVGWCAVGGVLTANSYTSLQNLFAVVPFPFAGSLCDGFSNILINSDSCSHIIASSGLYASVHVTINRAPENGTVFKHSYMHDWAISLIGDRPYEAIQIRISSILYCDYLKIKCYYHEDKRIYLHKLSNPIDFGQSFEIYHYYKDEYILLGVKNLPFPIQSIYDGGYYYVQPSSYISANSDFSSIPSFPRVCYIPAFWWIPGDDVYYNSYSNEETLWQSLTNYRSNDVVDCYKVHYRWSFYLYSIFNTLKGIGENLLWTVFMWSAFGFISTSIASWKLSGKFRIGGMDLTLIFAGLIAGPIAKYIFDPTFSILFYIFWWFIPITSCIVPPVCDRSPGYYWMVAFFYTAYYYYIVQVPAVWLVYCSPIIVAVCLYRLYQFRGTYPADYSHFVTLEDVEKWRDSLNQSKNTLSVNELAFLQTLDKVSWSKEKCPVWYEVPSMKGVESARRIIAKGCKTVEAMASIHVSRNLEAIPKLERMIGVVLNQAAKTCCFLYNRDAYIPRHCFVSDASVSDINYEVVFNNLKGKDVAIDTGNGNIWYRIYDSQLPTSPIWRFKTESFVAQQLVEPIARRDLVGDWGWFVSVDSAGNQTITGTYVSEQGRYTCNTKAGDCGSVVVFVDSSGLFKRYYAVLMHTYSDKKKDTDRIINGACYIDGSCPEGVVDVDGPSVYGDQMREPVDVVQQVFIAYLHILKGWIKSSSNEVSSRLKGSNFLYEKAYKLVKRYISVWDQRLFDKAIAYVNVGTDEKLNRNLLDVRLAGYMPLDLCNTAANAGYGSKQIQSRLAAALPMCPYYMSMSGMAIYGGWNLFSQCWRRSSLYMILWCLFTLFATFVLSLNFIIIRIYFNVLPFDYTVVIWIFLTCLCNRVKIVCYYMLIESFVTLVYVFICPYLGYSNFTFSLAFLDSYIMYTWGGFVSPMHVYLWLHSILKFDYPDPAMLLLVMQMRLGVLFMVFVIFRSITIIINTFAEQCYFRFSKYKSIEASGLDLLSDYELNLYIQALKNHASNLITIGQALVTKDTDAERAMKDLGAFLLSSGMNDSSKIVANNLHKLCDDCFKYIFRSLDNSLFPVIYQMPFLDPDADVDKVNSFIDMVSFLFLDSRTRESDTELDKVSSIVGETIILDDVLNAFLQHPARQNLRNAMGNFVNSIAKFRKTKLRELIDIKLDDLANSDFKDYVQILHSILNLNGEHAVIGQLVSRVRNYNDIDSKVYQLALIVMLRDSFKDDAPAVANVLDQIINLYKIDSKSLESIVDLENRYDRLCYSINELIEMRKALSGSELKALNTKIQGMNQTAAELSKEIKRLRHEEKQEMQAASSAMIRNARLAQTEQDKKVYLERKKRLIQYYLLRMLKAISYWTNAKAILENVNSLDDKLKAKFISRPYEINADDFTLVGISATNPAFHRDLDVVGNQVLEMTHNDVESWQVISVDGENELERQAILLQDGAQHFIILANMKIGSCSKVVEGLTASGLLSRGKLFMYCGKDICCKHDPGVANIHKLSCLSHLQSQFDEHVMGCQICFKRVFRNDGKLEHLHCGKITDRAVGPQKFYSLYTVMIGCFECNWCSSCIGARARNSMCKSSAYHGRICKDKDCLPGCIYDHKALESFAVSGSAIQQNTFKTADHPDGFDFIFSGKVIGSYRYKGPDVVGMYVFYDFQDGGKLWMKKNVVSGPLAYAMYSHCVSYGAKNSVKAESAVKRVTPFQQLKYEQKRLNDNKESESLIKDSYSSGNDVNLRWSPPSHEDLRNRGIRVNR